MSKPRTKTNILFQNLTDLEQSTQYLKYEVIQSVVNRGLPQHLQEKKITSPAQKNSQLEISGLYKELLKLEAREKKSLHENIY